MLNSGRLRLLSLLETLGTVRAVAEALHLSASTVSQQLAVLETETRCRLLERTGRKVRLTPAGLLLARRGREILDRMAEAEAELHALNDGRRDHSAGHRSDRAGAAARPPARPRPRHDGEPRELRGGDVGV